MEGTRESEGIRHAFAGKPWKIPGKIGTEIGNGRICAYRALDCVSHTRDKRTLKRTAMFYNFLFPQYLRGKAVSFLLLLIRLFFGVLFFMHGLDKMMDFNELSLTYPSVFGFGSYMTLMLSIFCEFACSMLLMTGLMTRIVLVPMVLSMAVAFFDIHDGMMPEGELSLIYLVVFLGLFIAGPGRYSVDYLIDTRIQKEKDQKI